MYFIPSESGRGEGTNKFLILNCNKFCGYIVVQLHRLLNERQNLRPVSHYNWKRYEQTVVYFVTNDNLRALSHTASVSVLVYPSPTKVIDRETVFSYTYYCEFTVTIFNLIEFYFLFFLFFSHFCRRRLEHRHCYNLCGHEKQFSDLYNVGLHRWLLRQWIQRAAHCLCWRFGQTAVPWSCDIVKVVVASSPALVQSSYWGWPHTSSLFGYLPTSLLFR